MTITEYIKSDLAARLHSPQGAPCKLTLEALSAHYGVSMTPVRHAVEDLVSAGVVCRHANGRLSPGGGQGTSIAESVAPPLPGGRALEESVRREVIRRSLRQDGDFLREQATAEQFAAGRTAVRQIFSRLAGAGLLEHVPRRGWRVTPYSEQDTLAYLEIRETLELKALDLARPQFTESALQQLLAANQPGAGRRPAKLDFDMHDYWIDRCGNRYIQEFFGRYSVFYNTLFNSAVTDSTVKRAMAQEHCEIVEALLEKDWRSARAALARHIRDQQQHVARMIAALRQRA